MEEKPTILLKPEVEESPEEALQKRIAKMEEEENKKTEEELKQVNEQKKPLEENDNKSGSLQKYQELFKSVPPLPPLPKFEAPTKPIFINQQKEPIIPQPPQLAKKTKAEFVKNPSPTLPLTGQGDKKNDEVDLNLSVSPTTEPSSPNPTADTQSDGRSKGDSTKMTYDKLFGNDNTS